MRFIRLVLFNYEAVVTTVNSPFFLDIGFGTNLGGSVPDISGLNLNTVGTIFLGMTDWSMSDYYATLSYNMSISGLTYSIAANSSVIRTQTGYIWYREAVCPSYYYNLSNLCAPCHYSCLTCISGTATGCTSCDGSNVTNRVYLSSNSSCPCMATFIDTGATACQAVLCYGYCNCSTNYVCTSCLSGSLRTLTNGSCVCGGYTADWYNQNPDIYTTCITCYPTCYSCSDMTNKFACVTCNLIRDHRSFNASQSTCDCIDGYF
jgi:hypothetical protein